MDLPPSIPEATAQAPTAGAPALASWLQRGAAYLIDTLIVTGLWLLTLAPVAGIMFILAPQGGEVDDDVGVILFFLMGLWFFAVIAIYIICYCWTNARPGERNGQSYGKQIVGIRVVCIDGRPVTWGLTMLRWIVGYWLISSFCLVYPLVDFLWPLFDQRRQALHDKLVDTCVVRVHNQ